MKRIFQLFYGEKNGDSWIGEERLTLAEAIRDGESELAHTDDPETLLIWVNEYIFPEKYETLDEYMNSEDAPLCLEASWSWDLDSLNFRKIREKSKLTQQAFSKKYGIPMRTVQSWETGEREPAEYVAELLARAVVADQRL